MIKYNYVEQILTSQLTSRGIFIILLSTYTVITSDQFQFSIGVIDDGRQAAIIVEDLRSKRLIGHYVIMRIIYHHTLSRYRDICFRTTTSRYYTSISAVRSFSTHTANDDVDTNKQLPSNKNRVPIALYRQLLAWSRRYRDVPFTNPIPPVTLQGPQVNPIALKRLNDMRTFLTPMIRNVQPAKMISRRRFGERSAVIPPTMHYTIKMLILKMI